MLKGIIYNNQEQAVKYRICITLKNQFMLKGIIYNNQEQADTLKLRLRNRVKGLFKGVTNEYTYTITHPTSGKVAVIIDENGPMWNDIFDELNPNDINNLVELGADWFINNDI
jgi:hypothetical protein